MTLRIQENVSLAPFTTFKIGGLARYFATASSLDEVHQAIAFARDRALPLFVLGGGSNVLIADEGFDGLVLRVDLLQVVFEERADRAFVTVGAGVWWDDFVAQMVERGYAGLECLSGIPGTVGGAVVANLGAYGAECSGTLVEVRVIDLQDSEGALKTFRNEECDFSYHDSFFAKHPHRYIIVEALFSFAHAQTVRPTYRDSRFNLANLVAAIGRPPTLAEVRAEVIKVRGEKGVLSTSYQSAGSFFHMPFVTAEEYAHIRAVAQELDAEKEQRLRPWAWEQADGRYKVAPGFLLEYTPFQKGYVAGAVGISPKHTLSVITSEGARARDVAALAQAMHDAVQNIFSISLEREVKYIGAVEK
ncbi:MAG: UDP-N-acetylmuramate dehydrogenase [Candidatus Paceibacterota bacterium]